MTNKASIKAFAFPTINILVASVIHWHIYSATPEFIEIFKAFGSDLSLITIFFIDWYYIIWPLNLLGIISFIFYVIQIVNYDMSHKTIWRELVFYNLLISFMVYALFIIAMYSVTTTTHADVVYAL